DANGVVHTGTTTGPASINAADAQRISMVALPKNDALTMLLSGSVGYEPALSAFDEGSSVVLAAGYDTHQPTNVPANTLGSIEIGGGTFRNTLGALATDTLAVTTSGGTIAFESAANLHALNSLTVSATGGGSITAADTLVLGAGTEGTGGTITVTAAGNSQIGVTNALTVDSSSDSLPYFGLGTYLDGQGGNTTMLADASTIEAASMFFTVAGDGRDDGATGGNGLGGTIDV